MTLSLFRPLLPMLVAGIVLAPALASAQPTPAKNRLDEQLFLLYAVEAMYRRGPKEAERRGVAELPTQVVARFVANRRLILDSLRQHIERKKDRDKYDEILTILRAYKKEIDLRDDSRKQLDQSTAKIMNRLAVVNAAAANQAMLTGLAFGLRGLAEGDEDNGFGRGLGALLASYIEEQRKVNAARYQAAQEWNEAYLAAARELGPKLVEMRRQFLEKFARTAKAMVAAKSWEDTEFAFENKLRTAPANRNPFLVIERARELLTKKDATVEELVEQAQLCVRAAEMVPADRIYNYYRAAFFGMGGMLANLAAAQDYGATGMPVTPKGVLKTGRRARTIWNDYVRNESLDSNINDEVIQGYILACAYGGDPTTAAALIQKTILQPVRFGNPVLRQTVSARPDFWYDCGRITSLVGNVLVAQQCLEQAARLGFREKESAKINPDLRNVRENRLTTDRFKRTFP